MVKNCNLLFQINRFNIHILLMCELLKIKIRTNVYMLYVHLGYDRNSGWSETYIKISLQHQPLFPNYKRKNGWSLVT